MPPCNVAVATFHNRWNKLSVYRRYVRCGVTTDVYHSYIGGQKSAMQSKTWRNTAMDSNGVEICQSKHSYTRRSGDQQPNREFVLTMPGRFFLHIMNTIVAAGHLTWLEVMIKNSPYQRK